MYRVNPVYADGQAMRGVHQRPWFWPCIVLPEYSCRGTTRVTLRLITSAILYISVFITMDRDLNVINSIIITQPSVKLRGNRYYYIYCQWLINQIRRLLKDSFNQRLMSSWWKSCEISFYFNLIPMVQKSFWFHLILKIKSDHNFPHGTIHYSDVIMGMIASQITSLTIVYSTVYSGAD